MAYKLLNTLKLTYKMVWNLLLSYNLPKYRWYHGTYLFVTLIP